MAPQRPRQIAKVAELAGQSDDGITVGEKASPAILDRIRKCLERANHPGTGRPEAEAALRMSTRLMSQFNVTQADVMSHAAADDRLKFAGKSVVRITSNREPRTDVIYQTWVGDAVGAITTFFDCKVYFLQYHDYITWTFYGIAEATVAAALAFEMVHNLILDWASKATGNKNSYCLGISEGLRQIAKRDRRKEERQAKAKERRELAVREQEEKLRRDAEIERLNQPAMVSDDDDDDDDDETSSTSSICPYDPDSDTDGTDDDVDFAFATSFEAGSEPPIDPQADFEEELARFVDSQGVKREPQLHDAVDDDDMNIPNIQTGPDPLEEGQDPIITTTTEAQEDEQDIKIEEMEPVESFEDTVSFWKTSQQLTMFRETATKIAEDYLASTKTKLSKGRKRTRNVVDERAYNTGWADSKKIEVKRRRITDGRT